MSLSHDWGDNSQCSSQGLQMSLSHDWGDNSQCSSQWLQMSLSHDRGDNSQCSSQGLQMFLSHDVVTIRSAPANGFKCRCHMMGLQFAVLQPRAPNVFVTRRSDTPQCFSKGLQMSLSHDGVTIHSAPAKGSKCICHMMG